MSRRDLDSRQPLSAWQGDDEQRPAGSLRWFLALGVTLVAFTAAGSLLGELSSSSWFMLLGTATVSLVLPLALTLWLRQLVGPNRPSPRLASLLLISNLVVCLVLFGLAGERTSHGLRQRGNWWVTLVADAVDLSADSVFRRAGERMTRWLAEKVSPTGAPSASRDRSTEAARRAARSSADPVERPSDTEGTHEAPLAERPGADSEDPPQQGDSAADEGSVAPQPEAPAGVTRIDFERHGRAIVVPVRLYGPRMHRDVKMLFDTGATLSTIDSRTLADLGLYVTSSDPTIDLQTANGSARRTITVIEGAAIYGAQVLGGLAVALCDECGGEDIIGLLGLNFARHFRVTVDHSAGVLQLERKVPPPDRLYDIRPFVQLTDIKGVQRGQQLSISLWLENRSPRPLRDVRLLAQSGDESLVRDVAEVGPGRIKLEMRGRVSEHADGFRVEVQRASWAAVSTE